MTVVKRIITIQKEILHLSLEIYLDARQTHLYNRPMKISDYISLPEAAKLTGFTRQGLHYRVKAGLLAAVKIGQQWFLTPDQVADLKAEKEAG